VDGSPLPYCASVCCRRHYYVNVWNRTKVRRGAAGIEHPLTPHALRHTFATRALVVVQDLLGHASPATTRVYTRVSSRRLRLAHREIFGYECVFR